MWLPESVYRQIYLCMWEMPDGRYIGNPDGEFLCAESYTIEDAVVEKKMRRAVVSYGITEGKPTWIAGRKVSHMEADDQMERLLEGKIPDEIEEAAIALEQEVLDKTRGVSEN